MERSVVFMLLLFIRGIPVSETTCVTKGCVFCFPNITNSTLTMQENATVSLDFSLAPGDGCRSVKNLDIQIWKGRGTDSRKMCVINQANGGVCPNPLMDIGCRFDTTPASTLCQLNKTLTRLDNTRWRWRADGFKLLQDINFNILYPPSVLKLDVNGNVSRGHTVHVYCRWQNGNPPVAATLLNNRGAEVNQSTQPELTHTIRDVSWHDAGTWMCQAPGAMENKTLTLSVRGKPEMRGQPTAQQNENQTVLTVPFYSHTSEFMQCELRNVSAESHSYNCSSLNFTMTGKLPNLTMSIQLETVTSELSTVWELRLTNDMGTCNVTFADGRVQREGGAPFPTTTPDPVPTTRAVSRADSTSTQRAAPAVSLTTPFDFTSLTVNVFVVTAMIFIIVCTRWGRLRYRLYSPRQRRPAPRRQLQSRHQRQPQFCGRQPSNHRMALPDIPPRGGDICATDHYDLINDDHIIVRPAAADGLATTRGTMPSPVPVLPTDYLHPIPAPEDLFATHSQQREEAGPAKGAEGHVGDKANEGAEGVEDN